MMTNTEPIDVGVIGVGSMGRHHARVYREFPTANLVGVADANPSTAEEVAAKNGVSAYSMDELLAVVDAVSIAVPTEYHVQIGTKVAEAGVDFLIEKPVAESVDAAWQLQGAAQRHGVVAQVGHIERFNPAIRKLHEVVNDLDIVSLRTQRLGPAPERTIADSAVVDLMVHDVDIVLSLLDEQPRELHALGVEENRHASALLEFSDGVMASLTASRKTQRKVRTLEITAEDCFIEVDYMDQSIEVHRNSVPEYVSENGGVRFREESIVERPRIETGEPLRFELESFLDAVRRVGNPLVSLEDGILALELIQDIEREALDEQQKPMIPADD